MYSIICNYNVLIENGKYKRKNCISFSVKMSVSYPLPILLLGCFYPISFQDCFILGDQHFNISHKCSSNYLLTLYTVISA